MCLWEKKVFKKCLLILQWLGDKIVIVTDNLSTKKTNTIATDVTNTASIDCHNKEVKNCCILHAVLLAIILLLIIIIICYLYAKQKVII